MATECTLRLGPASPAFPGTRGRWGVAVETPARTIHRESAATSERLATIPQPPAKLAESHVLPLSRVRGLASVALSAVCPYARFVNEGTYEYNVVLPMKDDDIDNLAQAAITAGDRGFVPVAVREKLLAWTQHISPHETGELTLVVAGPGSYTFVHLFPRHAQTMLGTIRPLK